MSGGVVDIETFAHGGDGIGRLDGKTVFVAGAVPGDTVSLAILEEKARFVRAGIGSLLASSEDRIEPPCPVFDRCGGCDWQMLELNAQRRWKAEILAGQLRHLGGMESIPPIGIHAVGPGFGYRNRIDLRVDDGRPALLETGSHVKVPIDDCPLVIEPIRQAIGRLDIDADTDRITVRANAGGEVLILRRRAGRWERGRLIETVGDHEFQITDRAFFQVNTAGAGVLGRVVADQLDIRTDDVLLDGYAGGGLFSRIVGDQAGRVVAVENNRRALLDLARNAPEAEVIAAPFEKAPLPSVDVAVVDPPRTGMGATGVAALLATHPRRLAYVACDPAALARDTRKLLDHGFDLDRVDLVDMFPQTHHIESVALFTRAG